MKTVRYASLLLLFFVNSTFEFLFIISIIVFALLCFDLLCDYFHPRYLPDLDSAASCYCSLGLTFGTCVFTIYFNNYVALVIQEALTDALSNATDS